MRRTWQRPCPALLVTGLALTLAEPAGATNAAYAQLDASGEAVYQMMLRHSTPVLPKAPLLACCVCKGLLLSRVEPADVPCVVIPAAHLTGSLHAP